MSSTFLARRLHLSTFIGCLTATFSEASSGTFCYRYVAWPTSFRRWPAQKARTAVANKHKSSEAAILKSGDHGKWKDSDQAVLQ